MALTVAELSHWLAAREPTEPVVVEGNGLHAVIGVTHGTQVDGTCVTILLIESPDQLDVEEERFDWE